MPELRLTKAFYDKYHGPFSQLLDDCTRHCKVLQNDSNPFRIRDIYDRRRANSGVLYKDPRKTIQKLKNWELSITDANLFKVNDLVGMTVVLQYPDQVASFLDKLRSSAKVDNIDISESRRHTARNGYYADHVDAVREHEGVSIICEIQFKSVLHDAWSSKMHDLTYKPLGSLDPRISALMTSIAATIESLEAQSCLIRDMITSGWDVEQEIRDLARGEMLSQVLTTLRALPPTPERQESLEIYDGLIQNRHRINECLPNDEVFKEAKSKIHKLCSTSETLRFGLPCLTLLASLRQVNEFKTMLRTKIDEWIEAIPRQQEKIANAEITALPLVYYARGDLDQAIESAEKLLALGPTHIDQQTSLDLRANILSFKAERAYFYPPSKQAKKALLEESTRELDDLEKAPELADTISALVDTRGLTLIACATTPKEVREGIQLCQEAARKGSVDKREIVEAYEELNVRLGWRRYFEIEAAFKYSVISVAGR